MDIRNGKIILETTADRARAAAGIDRGDVLGRHQVQRLVSISGEVTLTASDSVGLIDGLAANVESGMSRNVVETKKQSLEVLKQLAQIGLAKSMQAETTNELVRQAIEQLQPISPDITGEGQ